MNPVLTTAAARRFILEDLQRLGSAKSENLLKYPKTILTGTATTTCAVMLWALRPSYFAFASSLLTSTVMMGVVTLCVSSAYLVGRIAGLSRYILYLRIGRSDDAPIQGKNLARIAHVWSDAEFKRTLLSKMDLRQLGEVRQLMGRVAFRQLIASSEEPQLQLWKVIDKISSSKTQQEIEQGLTTLEASRKATWFEAVVGQIEHDLHDEKVYETVRPRLWRMVPSLSNVTFRFADPKFSPIVITQRAAQKIKGAFLPLALGLTPAEESVVVNPKRQEEIFQAPAQPFPNEVQVASEFMQAEEDYFTIQRILKRSNGERVACSLTTWLNDLRFANQFFGDSGFKTVEADFAQLEIDETFANYQQICRFYQENSFSHNVQFVQKLKTLFFQTSPTDAQVEAFAREFNFSGLNGPTKQRLINIYLSKKDSSVLCTLYDKCEEEEFLTLLRQVPIKHEFFKMLFAFFESKQDSNGRAAYAYCIEQGRLLNVDDKIQIWGPFGIPADLRSE